MSIIIYKLPEDIKRYIYINNFMNKIDINYARIFKIPISYLIKKQSFKNFELKKFILSQKVLSPDQVLFTKCYYIKTLMIFPGAASLFFIKRLKRVKEIDSFFIEKYIEQVNLLASIKT